MACWGWVPKATEEGLERLQYKAMLAAAASSVTLAPAASTSDLLLLLLLLLLTGHYGLKISSSAVVVSFREISRDLGFSRETGRRRSAS